MQISHVKDCGSLRTQKARLSAARKNSCHALPAPNPQPPNRHPLTLTPSTPCTPPTPPTKAKKKSWFQPGFLLPDEPILKNANPKIPIVGLLMSSGDSKANIELTKVFNNLHRDRAD